MKNSASFEEESNARGLMYDTIFQSRAYAQVPRNPKIELLFQDVNKASWKHILALNKALNENDSKDAVYILDVRKCFKSKLEILMNFVLEIDAELNQADLN